MRNPPKIKIGQVKQVLDGKAERWYIDSSGSALYPTVCCDCSLVHIEQLTPRDGYISVKVWRDDVLTDALRKKKRKRTRKKGQ